MLSPSISSRAVACFPSNTSKAPSGPSELLVAERRPGLNARWERSPPAVVAQSPADEALQEGFHELRLIIVHQRATVGATDRAPLFALLIRDRKSTRLNSSHITI